MRFGLEMVVAAFLFKVSLDLVPMGLKEISFDKYNVLVYYVTNTLEI
jgi:hypothetical protein